MVYATRKKTGGMLWHEEKRFVQQGKSPSLFHKIEHDAKMYDQYSRLSMLTKRRRGVIVQMPKELSEWVNNNQEYIKAREK